ncbi:MAG TPA: site-2 protease family protein [Gammaproteobacteria bacterium]|jgi:Zn-dependent protease|nr:site-2 protease family protein [Gammaproteobacteria bacterium]
MLELNLIQKIAIWALPLIFAMTLHEVAHGYVAYLLGDHTAKLSGRLTANPMKHIDLFGTVLIPLFMLTVTNFIFGWAKPIIVDSRNLRHLRRDLALVALAGPVSNLLMALFWAMIAKIGLIAQVAGNGWFGVPLSYMGSAGVMINVVLAVLNLLPLPPLDGGNIVRNLLPARAAHYLSLIEPYSFWILILLLFSGLLTFLIAPPVYFLVNGIGYLFGL